MKYLLIAILSLASSCAQIASANTPDWVLGKGHPSFPNSKYLIGVGLSEKSPITASESARAELIKNIRVKINSALADSEAVIGLFSERPTPIRYLELGKDGCPLPSTQSGVLALAI
jgi:hypothetical protein